MGIFTALLALGLLPLLAPKATSPSSSPLFAVKKHQGELPRGCFGAKQPGLRHDAAREQNLPLVPCLPLPTATPLLPRTSPSGFIPGHSIPNSLPHRLLASRPLRLPKIPESLLEAASALCSPAATGKMSSCPNAGAAGASSSPVPGSGWVLRVLAQPFLHPLFGERGLKGLVLLSLLSSIPQRASWCWGMLQDGPRQGTKASAGEHPSAPCLLPSVCSSLAASQQVPGVRVCPSGGVPSVPAPCHLAGVPSSARGSSAPSRSPSQPCRRPGESEPAWFVRRGYAVLGSLCAVWCELCRKTTKKKTKQNTQKSTSCLCV